MVVAVPAARPCMPHRACRARHLDLKIQPGVGCPQASLRPLWTAWPARPSPASGLSYGLTWAAGSSGATSPREQTRSSWASAPPSRADDRRLAAIRSGKRTDLQRNSDHCCREAAERSDACPRLSFDQRESPRWCSEGEQAKVAGAVRRRSPGSPPDDGAGSHTGVREERTRSTLRNRCLSCRRTRVHPDGHRWALRRPRGRRPRTARSGRVVVVL